MTQPDQHGSAFGPARALPGPGVALGDYVIERELGRGGMAAVYVGRHRELGSRYALKVLQLTSEASAALRRERFEREARALARIEGHPGVVRIHHFEVLPSGLAFFALELVEDGDLERALETAPFPLERALALAEGIARALAHVHAAGVVHRDLKPANVLLRGGQAPVLTDFGIARDEREERLTHSQAFLGTPEYMAPEQVEGSRQVGPASDVFALGGILYRMLCGRPPFEAESAPALLATILSVDPTPPRALRPELPPRVEEVVLAALEKEPARRPRAAELADALAALRRGEGGGLRGSSWTDRAWRRVRRAGPARLLALPLAALLASGAAWLALEHTPARRLHRELAALAHAPEAAVDADPLLEGEARERAARLLEQVERLLAEAGQGELDAALRAGAAGPLAALSADERAALARLRARSALAEGQGWVERGPCPRAPAPALSGEQSLRAALVLLAWRRRDALEAPSEREAAQALLSAAAGCPEPGVSRAAVALQGTLRAVELELTRAEAALRDALARVLTGEGTTAGSPVARPEPDDPLATYRARRLRERATEDLPARVTQLEDFVVRARPERWRSAEACGDLARALAHVLVPWWRETARVPSAALRPGITRLLGRCVDGLTRAAPSGEVRGLYRLLEALDAAPGLVDWVEEPLRGRLLRLLFNALHGHVLAGTPLPASVFVAFVHLRENPTGQAVLQQAQQLVRDRAFEAALRQAGARRGELFVAQGLCLASLTELTPQAAVRRELQRRAAEAFAAALGPALDPATRARLELPAAEPLARPLDAWGAAYARSRLLRCLTGRVPDATLVDEVEALLPAARAELRGIHSLDLCSWAARLCLDVSAAAEDAATGRRRAEQAVALADPGVEQALDWLAPLASRAERAAGDAPRYEYALLRLLGTQAEALVLLERAPDAAARYARTVARLGERTPLGIRLPYAGLLLTCGDRAGALIAAQTVADEVGRAPGGTGGERRELRASRDAALAIVALARAQRGERAAAQAGLSEAVAAGGGKDGLWLQVRDLLAGREVNPPPHGHGARWAR
ncbi:MAG: protein kinase [Planctomycetota bacterium]